MEIKQKTVLITGGTAGIGLEAARQFLNAGAHVMITGRNAERLAKVKERYPALVTFKSDVADPDDAVKLYRAIDAMGGIDMLYHNAGVGSPPLNLARSSDQHYEHAAYEMDVNYMGVIRLNNIFLDMLKLRKDSAIIITTSILSYVPSLLAPTYSASKVALRFYTESLRQHLKVLRSPLKVFELLPPLVDTDMAAGFDDAKISPETLINALLKALARDQFTIRVGNTKALYALNRIFPGKAFQIMNAKKFNSFLK